MYIVVLCVQDGNTPMQLAVNRSHHKTVHLFIKEAEMDIKWFDKVCNIDTLFCLMYVYIIVVGGVAWLVITVGGAIIVMYVALLEDVHVLILTVIFKWRIIGYYINTGLYYVHNVYWYCIY